MLVGCNQQRAEDEIPRWSAQAPYSRSVRLSYSSSNAFAQVLGGILLVVVHLLTLALALTASSYVLTLNFFPQVRFSSLQFD